MDDIIRMAKESGGGTTWWPLHTDTLERFAALVRADERNKLAAWMQAQGYATGHGETMEGLLKELDWQVRESEREACAKVCDDMAVRSYKDIRAAALESAAENMRARGNT